MKTLADVVVMIVSIVLGVYFVAFALVGACLVASSHPVSQCRDNLAGALVYKTVSILL